MEKKVIVTGVAAALVIGGCFFPAHTFAKNEEETLEKEETVYVIGDASGKSEQVLVSDWIKNTAKKDKIEDQSSLEEIVNVKGNETFTQDKTSLVWDAQGNDIYYQGTVKHSPVNVKVSYMLDGKEVTPEEIKGKSGHVTMKVTYLNETKVTRDGAEKTVPMLMVSGLMLDTKTFHNVSIDHGKVINDGSKYLVAGFGITGLEDRVSFTSDFMASTFTLEADTDAFATSEMLTYAGSDVLKMLELSDENDFDTLIDSVSQLEDASGQLVSGSEALADGMQTLQSQTAGLVQGVSRLDEGAGSLNTGLDELTQGLGRAKDGSEQLLVALTQVSEGIDQLAQGRGQLLQALSQMELGFDSAVNALQQSITYEESVVQYLTALKEKLPESEHAQLAQVIAAAQGSIQYQQGVQATLSNSTQSGTLRNGLSQMQSALGEQGQMSQGFARLQFAMNAKKESEGTSGIIESMGSLGQGILSAYNGSSALSTGAKTLRQGTSQLNQAKDALASGISQLNDGSTTLRDGMKTFHETGIQALVKAVNNDFKGLIDALQEASEDGKAYQNFSGIDDAMTGSVKFIIKTAGISE